MNIDIELNINFLERFLIVLKKKQSKVLIGFAFLFSLIAIILFFFSGDIVRYGDAESHLNIAKRVVHSITPGLAQLGGIWLPLPHMLMVPFVFFDPLWRSGLAGSIVSGASFIVVVITIFQLTLLITQNKWASLVASVVFMINPNVLYMQSTPMTELPLIAFYTLSTYFFVAYLYSKGKLNLLLLAAFFGFCTTLTRYDGWFLVLFEALILLHKAVRERKWKGFEGKVILFSTLAFLGILLWFVWDFLILGDPLYFTNSQFSAKTQQLNWLARGELPAYHHMWLSFVYYSTTWMSNAGPLIFFAAVSGIFLFLKNKQVKEKFYIFILFFVPFIFNVTTLFMGQSVIFIPHITPVSFEWRLFNVRYGLMMVPISSLFFAYMFLKVKNGGKLVLVGLLVLQIFLYIVGYSPIISLADGTQGLSSAKRPNAERWLKEKYDGGLVLMDDYARTVSIVRTNIPMQQIIYIGNKPYWEESLREPDKYARWIVMQKDDEVWKHIYTDSQVRGRLYKYFSKVYTSPEILIFKRNK